MYVNDIYKVLGVELKVLMSEKIVYTFSYLA